VLTCKMLAGAVKQGQARFTAHSLAKNLKQLHVCMRVVAAEKSVVRWEREWVKKDGEVARKWMHCQGLYSKASIMNNSKIAHLLQSLVHIVQQHHASC
jgi:hypothetical protein